MSDPILLLLAADAVALILLGIAGAMVPRAFVGLLAVAFSGLGAILCLLPLLSGASAATLGLPFGPPELPLRLALDPLSGFFLLIVLAAGTAIAAFQTTVLTAARPGATARRSGTGPVRRTVLCAGGTILALLAADGMTLTIGLALACAAVWRFASGARGHATLLVPLLVLIATCLLAPSGFPPRFDAIRAAPVDPGRAAFAAGLTVIAFAALGSSRSEVHGRDQDVLTGGMLLPAGSYLLLRLVTDLSAAAGQTQWGFALLLIGSAVAVLAAWHATACSDIDHAVTWLMRRGAGLIMAGIGLALIARAADLPGAAAFALAAVFLYAVAGGLAGVLASLAIQAIGTSAGGFRLANLGGLAQLMPVSAGALATGLFAQAALPPGIGFASLWLLFQAILAAPRTGGLSFQLPLALMGAALALSAALATAASVRLIGVALLGRPRSPRGAGAAEVGKPSRRVLQVLAGLALAAGILPGPVLWMLADQAILPLSGAPPGARVGLALLLPSSSAPSYLALPVFALLALATGAVYLLARRARPEARAAGLWADGMEPPFGLPFGDPAAQSAGDGFLPKLPALPMPRLPALPRLPPPRAIPAAAGPWLLLAAFTVLLAVLALAG